MSMRDENCPICLDPLKNRKLPIELLACSHMLHRECALSAVARGNLTCPMCRTPVTEPARLRAAVTLYQQGHGMAPDNYEFPTAEWAGFYFASEDSADDADDDEPPPQQQQQQQQRGLDIMSALRAGTLFVRFILHTDGRFALHHPGGPPAIVSQPVWQGSDALRPAEFTMHMSVVATVVRFKLLLLWETPTHVLEMVYYADTHRTPGRRFDARSGVSVLWNDGVRYKTLRDDVLHFDGAPRDFDAGGVVDFVSRNAEAYVSAVTPPVLARWRAISNIVL